MSRLQPINTEKGLTPPRLHSQPSSAAAAALSDKILLKTNIAAAVGCSDWFGAFEIA